MLTGRGLGYRDDYDDYDDEEILFDVDEIRSIMTFDVEKDETEDDGSENDETKPFLPINHIVPVTSDDGSIKTMDSQTGLEVITEAPNASIHDYYDRHGVNFGAVNGDV